MFLEFGQEGLCGPEGPQIERVDDPPHANLFGEGTQIEGLFQCNTIIFKGYGYIVDCGTLAVRQSVYKACPAIAVIALQLVQTT